MKTIGIAEFQKVSLDEYLKTRHAALGGYDNTGERAIEDAFAWEWQNIKLPTRSTSGAAGYDFYLPYDVVLTGMPVTIHTGVCCEIDPGWVLMVYPRSGLGFKYGVRLSNSTGVIDEDFIHADNEGHIALRMYAADKSVVLHAGDRFAQGIFLPYGTAINGNTDSIRHGGTGSTGLR